nr:MAG TPA: hypothetical protein [Caudoviricetes sp.]
MRNKSCTHSKQLCLTYALANKVVVIYLLRTNPKVYRRCLTDYIIYNAGFRYVCAFILLLFLWLFRTHFLFL